MSVTRLERINAALEADGLSVRGYLDFAEGDAPHVSGNVSAKSVVLIGHAGSTMWPRFTEWLSAQKQLPQNPLDTWSKQIIGPVAVEHGGHAVFPSDTPYLPFQQWAMMAEGLRPSPLGMLIHPEYGLWYAYRGAILFDKPLIKSERVEKTTHACDTCLETPCLSACPVSAFSDDGYAVDRCRSHLATPQGQSCMGDGCFARRACPIGREYVYLSEQIQFHMSAFKHGRDL